MPPEKDRHAEVLRLGHRPQRDQRLTSHVGLTARAFGADRIHIEGGDEKPKSTVEEVTRRFGGDFEVSLVDSPKRLIKDWDGEVVHLTMYGVPVEDVIDDVRSNSSLLVVVGSQKVSGYVYGNSDYNVGVTNQPHSEVAALSVFLHEYFEGEELDQNFEGGEVEVVPSESSKLTEELDDG